MFKIIFKLMFNSNKSAMAILCFHPIKTMYLIINNIKI